MFRALSSKSLPGICPETYGSCGELARSASCPVTPGTHRAHLVGGPGDFVRPARLDGFLTKLRRSFPNFKCYVEWDNGKNRHIVNQVEFTDRDQDIIARVVWPTQDEILEALDAIAFDDIETLRQANCDVSTLLASHPVE